jgi:hypothetical protein
MKRSLLSLIQVALVGCAFVVFLSLTPWLGCESLTTLPEEYRAQGSVPEWAVCYTNNRGQIAFHEHGLISREPLRFGLHVGVFIALVIGLIFSVWKSRSIGKFSRSHRA